MQRVILIVAMVAACGPSASEVKTAKTTTYNADPQVILKAAMQAAEAEHYKLGEIDQENTRFATVPKYFTREGSERTPGAGDYVQLGDRAVSVTFIVTVSGTPPIVAVDVTPKTFQVLAGSPQPRELKPDDPNLPGFVTGRVDELSLAIYQRAKPYALASSAVK
ncbi:MAG: hypothetical protein ACM31C_34100 [Acidobacteriota bacterium]